MYKTRIQQVLPHATCTENDPEFMSINFIVMIWVMTHICSEKLESLVLVSQVNELWQKTVVILRSADDE